MSKLLIVLMAAVFAMALSEVAAADDADQNKQQAQAVRADDPGAGGAIATQREWEYLAALQKCETLTDTEKTNCVDAAREKYGQM
jgi:hypothetical protein